MATKHTLVELLREARDRLGPTAFPSLAARIAEAIKPPGEMPQPETRARLNDIAAAIDERLPEGYGFIALVFPMGDAPGILNYVSNARREDAINTLKEFLIQAGGAEDWMQHIK